MHGEDPNKLSTDYLREIPRQPEKGVDPVRAIVLLPEVPTANIPFLHVIVRTLTALFVQLSVFST